MDATPTPVAPYMLDPTFGVGGTLEITLPGASQVDDAVLVPTPDGMIVFSHVIIDHIELVFCRISDAGVLDPSFGGGCVVPAWSPGSVASPSAAVDGTALLVPGQSRLGDPVFGPAVFRLRSDGTLDPSFGVNGAVPLAPPASESSAFAESILELADGSHAVVGGFSAGGRWLERVVGTSTESSISITQSPMVPLNAGVVSLQSHEAGPMECPETACGTGEVCRYASCTAPLPPCSGGCPPGRCDAMLQECLPDTIDPVGTDVTQRSSSLAIVGRRRVAGLDVAAAFSLPDERVFVAGSRGNWIMTAQGTRDPSFGGDHAVPLHGDVLAVAARADGRIVAATATAFGAALEEVNANGSEVGEVEIADHVITSLHSNPDSTLLTAGVRGAHTFVQRWIHAP